MTFLQSIWVIVLIGATTACVWFAQEFFTRHDWPSFALCAFGALVCIWLVKETSE